MSNLENNSLIAALEEAKCKDLPPELKDGEVFVQALVRVLKSNNREAFCYAINDGMNKPKITRSYGSVARIVRVLSIHPLSVLDRNYIPHFEEREEVKGYLLHAGENQDYITRLFNENTEESKATIKALIIKSCINDQLADEIRTGNEQRRVEQAVAAAKQAEREQAEKEAARALKEQDLKQRIKEQKNDKSKVKAKRGRKAADATGKTV